MSRTLKISPLQLFIISGLSIFIGLVLGVVAVVTGHAPINQVATTPNIATVLVTSQGFSPATLRVSPDTVVIWLDEDTAHNHVIASNPYPADNANPGLKSSQLGNGAQFRYKFTQRGTYHYHDDLHPTLNGTVVVQ